jgi:hypothetical protein
MADPSAPSPENVPAPENVPPVFETSRLRLRRWRDTDAPGPGEGPDAASVRFMPAGTDRDQVTALSPGRLDAERVRLRPWSDDDLPRLLGVWPTGCHAAGQQATAPSPSHEAMSARCRSRAGLASGGAAGSQWIAWTRNVSAARSAFRSTRATRVSPYRKGST